MKAPTTTDELREILSGDILVASQALLGTILHRGERSARIVEVEAYRAIDDPGSHAFRGPTPRNLVMYGPSGRAYVYFSYGTHWMLNVVGHEEGSAAAILVRAAVPLTGKDTMYSRRPKAKKDEDLLSGPGKLAAAFDIERKDNGIDLLDPASDLRIEPGNPPQQIFTGPRIGLAVGKGELLPWRFVDADHLPYVSKPHKELA